MRRFFVWGLAILATALVTTGASLGLTLWLAGPSSAASAQAGTPVVPTTADMAAPTTSPDAGISAVDAGSAQAVAIEFVRAAAGGAFAHAATLSAPCAPETDVGAKALEASVQHFAPVVQSAGVLPGQPYVLNNACKVNARTLVWVTYELQGKQVLAAYNVDLVKQNGTWAVGGFVGPVVPPHGYPLFEAPVYNDQGQRLSSSAWQGKSLLLVSPRQPTPALPGQLEHLRQVLQPLGVKLVLALDLGSPPDWERFATAHGFKGDIWLLKGKIEQIPTPGNLQFLGCMGLMVDPAGQVMGGFSALDPATYGLTGEPDAIAAQVLAAYHMTR